MARPSVKDADFVGRDAYLEQRDEAPAAVLCTLTVDDHTSTSGVKRYMLGREPILAQDGTPLVDAKGRRSYVTSAGSGPSVGKHLLMSYLPPDQAVEGNKLLVEYFGERYPVTVAVAGQPADVRSGQRADPELTPGMRILALVKRVPATGGRIALTDDGRAIDTRFLGFVVSPHEECAVEEAVRLIEAHGGESVVMTLGPAEAADQLRDALAIGIDRAVLLETDGSDWDPMATSAALTEAVRRVEAADGPFDLILVGNESADSGGYQVGIRVAVALDRPVVTGIKALEIDGGVARARRQVSGGWDVFELPLPAVVGVREGINLPRYPSVPGRLRAKKKEIDTASPERASAGGPTLEHLKLPVEQEAQVEILGTGPEAAPRVVEVLREIGIV